MESLWISKMASRSGTFLHVWWNSIWPTTTYGMLAAWCGNVASESDNKLEFSGIIHGISALQANVRSFFGGIHGCKIPDLKWMIPSSQTSFCSSTAEFRQTHPSLHLVWLLSHAMVHQIRNLRFGADFYQGVSQMCDALQHANVQLHILRLQRRDWCDFCRFQRNHWGVKAEIYLQVVDCRVGDFHGDDQVYHWSRVYIYDNPDAIQTWLLTTIRYLL